MKYTYPTLTWSICGLLALVSLVTLISLGPEPNAVENVLSGEQLLPTDETPSREEYNQLRYQRDIEIIRSDLLKAQSTRFESLISLVVGFFGTLITAVVIYFAFRFGKDAVREAKSAAVDAARSELTDEREIIQGLLTDAKNAVSIIRDHEETASKLIQSLEIGRAPQDAEVVGQIANLATSALKKPRTKRTVEDFRAIVLDAFRTEDWGSMERRAATMQYLFEEDMGEESLAFAQFHRAYALRKEGLTSESNQAYEQLVRTYETSENDAAKEYAAMSLYNWANALSEEASSLKGVDATALWDKVSENYAAALKYDDKDDRVLHNWGTALLDQARQTDMPEAREFYTRAFTKLQIAAKLKDSSAETYLNWALGLSNQAARESIAENAIGLLVDAGEKFELAHERDPKDAAVLSNWGEALSDQGSWLQAGDATQLFLQANEKFESAVEADRGRSKTYADWGHSLIEQSERLEPKEATGVFRRAFDLFEKALELEEKSADVLQLWGSALLEHADRLLGRARTARIDAAIEKLSMALEIAPTDYPNSYLLGTAYAQKAIFGAKRDLRKNIDFASKHFAEAQELEPTESAVLATWGFSLAEFAERGTPKEAEDYFEVAYRKINAAIEIDNDTADHLDSLGHAKMLHAKMSSGLKATRLFLEAKESMLQAEELQEGSASYNLACLASLQSNPIEAAEWLVKCKTFPKEWPGCWFIARDSDFDNVRDSQEFTDALARVGCV